MHILYRRISLQMNNICQLWVYLTFPDETSLKHCDACGVNCSNFDAEIIAITSAIKNVNQYFEDRERDPCDLVIFTDSKSTLQALMDVFQEQRYQQCTLS